MFLMLNLSLALTTYSLFKIFENNQIDPTNLQISRIMIYGLPLQVSPSEHIISYCHIDAQVEAIYSSFFIEFGCILYFL